MTDPCEVGRPRWEGDRMRGPACERPAVWRARTERGVHFLCQEHADALAARLAAAGRRAPTMERMGEDSDDAL